MIKFLTAILMLLIAVGLFIGFTRPSYSEVQALQEQGSQLDQILAEATEFQRLKSQLIERYNSLPAVHLERLSKMVPDHVDNVRLILDVDSLAADNDLTLENVLINSATAEDEEDRTPLGAVSAGRSVFESLTLQFKTTGTYADFLGFLQSLESSLRLVDVADLNLRRDDTVQGEPIYDFEVTIRTYWLK